MVNHATRHAFFNGAPQPNSSDPSSTFQSYDPSTSLPLCTIHTTTPSALESAIASAQAAFPAWSSTPIIERSRILHRAVRILRSRNDELARIETLDTGKAVSETSTVDVVTGADVLEYYASLIASGGLNGESFALRPTAHVYTSKEPLGVCAGIGAFNYPLQIALWKSAPCLAAGNCMVYKPSEVTPLHAQLLAEIYLEAGLPKGVFNVVYGAGGVGSLLTAHPAIAKVSFTGQVSTGQKVAKAAGEGMKYATMELGGKSALIVLPDADVDKAVDGAMMANFFSSGQVCTNGTRVFVPESLKSEFERVLLQKLRFIRVGDPLDEKTNMGPLVSASQRDKVIGLIKHGVQVDRATLLQGGAEAPPALPRNNQKGFYVRPTVFTNCTDSMKIVREEIFGPVMAILPYPDADVEGVIARANDTKLGLAAGVFGRNEGQCLAVVRRLEAGIAWVNSWGESPAEMAVGGWKMSGLGVENGRRGLEGWTRNRSVLVESSGEVGSVFTEQEPEAQKGSEKGKDIVKSKL